MEENKQRKELEILAGQSILNKREDKTENEVNKTLSETSQPLGS